MMNAPCDDFQICESDEFCSENIVKKNMNNKNQFAAMVINLCT